MTQNCFNAFETNLIQRLIEDRFTNPVLGYLANYETVAPHE